MKIALKIYFMFSILSSLPIFCSDRASRLIKPTAEQIQIWAILVDASGISKLEYAKSSRSDLVAKLSSQTSSSTLNRDALQQLIAFEDEHPSIVHCKTVAQQAPARLNSVHAEVSKEEQKEDARKRLHALRAQLRRN